MAERRISEEITMSTRTSHSSTETLWVVRKTIAAMACFALFVVLTLIGAGKANAAMGDGVEIFSFSATPSTTQAGGHPNLTIEFDVENHNTVVLKDPDDPTKFHPCFCNEPKDIIIDLPAGFIGNPSATPQCNAQQFAFDDCPIDSQVGYTFATPCLEPGFSPPGGCTGIGFPNPVYNLVPPPGVAGLTGWKLALFNAPVYTSLTARTGSDYGLRASTLGLERVLPVTSFKQVMWGVPAEPAHDLERFKESCVLLCFDLTPPTTG